VHDEDWTGAVGFGKEDLAEENRATFVASMDPLEVHFRPMCHMWIGIRPSNHYTVFLPVRVHAIDLPSHIESQPSWDDPAVDDTETDVWTSPPQELEGRWWELAWELACQNLRQNLDTDLGSFDILKY